MCLSLVGLTKFIHPLGVEWDSVVDCFPKAVVPDNLLMKYEASRACVEGGNQSLVTDDNLAAR